MTPFWFYLWPTAAAVLAGAMMRSERIVWRSVLLMAAIAWITMALLELACL